MPIYTVNADFTINVSTEVEAEDEQAAREQGWRQIMAGNYDPGDPVDDPKINWVEPEGGQEEYYACPFCGQDGCDCDLL